MTVRTEEMIYHFRAGLFLEKWVQDVADTQCLKTGSITDTAPFKWGMRPADPVSISYLLVAWLTFLHYGDTQIMERHYEGFREWVEFLAARSENGIVRYSHWGDWAPPAAFADPASIGAGAVSKDTPGELVSTGYFYYHCTLLADMAKSLGKECDFDYYAAKAVQVAEAFNRTYWNEVVGGYGSNNQSCNALALFLKIVPKENIIRVLENIVSDVSKNNDHLTTGNLCTKYLLEVLTEYGRVDVAYRIATQKTYPSWGFMLENGATTLWERWEYSTDGAMHSHNHPMLGSVASWMFKYLAGIMPDFSKPGCGRLLIRPHVLDQVGWVKASYETLYGLVNVDWRRSGDSLELHLSIPVNCQAEVTIPNAKSRDIQERNFPIENNEEIELLDECNGCARLGIGSGDYAFAVRLTNL